MPWSSFQNPEHKLVYYRKKKIHLTTWKKVNEFIYFFLRVKKLQVHERCYYQAVNKPSQYDRVSCAPTPFLFFETQSHITRLDCSSVCGWEWPCISGCLVSTYSMRRLQMCSTMCGPHAEWSLCRSHHGFAQCWRSKPGFHANWAIYLPCLSCTYFCPPHRTWMPS